MLPRYVVITAGGKGVRMNTTLPKQFINLKGRPILMRTIEVFLNFDSTIHIIVVLPLDQIPVWKELCVQHNFLCEMNIIEGGPTRFHSVKNGLKLVPDQSLVAIHDGVRPLVSYAAISEAFLIADKFGNAIPVIGINESVRIVENAFNKPIARDSLRIIQTPQCFQSDLIKKAYKTNYHSSFTDDASVFEQTGERIYLSQGNKENIKITTPEDLMIAEAILASNPEEL